MGERLMSIPRKIKAIWIERFPSFKPASSRWGFFFTLLALSGFLIAIGYGDWVGMNGFIIAGIVVFGIAIGFGIYCIIKESKDITATSKDIEALGNTLGAKLDKLGTKIDNLANEIKLERESRNGKSK